MLEGISGAVARSRSTKRPAMNRLVYLVGLVVIVVFILGFFGLG